ncbi:P-type conjugative transfer protein TrbL [Xanthomonas euvesicatoria]|uniref:P-type conjugative transfer protein TrbL n=1 Tax=Xanthomonas euvesicatoria TaxID=456327 RepID=UPI00022667DF|nr:P-type conjugative transfer protein TrbL [Xanthomonas euvesicatoria]AEO42547.1 conjugal transfer protein TrbL [Xanthomonas euvesicatoria pv. citrumelo F1]PPU87725.1 P-type conjugative transfer protein TrbL [Xanthomonas euvesicatoria pv. citrumelonis]TKA15500.1 conjugal transfer protein TrbL [Xanthomonas euvesicatoria pv. citrumelonis]
MKALHKAALIGVTLALYSTAASAQLTNQGMLDQVVTEFATRATAWQTVVMNAATFLFWTLGTISLVWTFGFMALRKADIGEFFAEFIRFILFFGFFLWLLRNGPAFANSIIQSLARIGEQASGVASVTPSGIVDIGFMILKQAFRSSSIWSPVDSFIGVALSVGILVLLAVVAVNMLLLLVSGWLLMYAGIFFLGFGGSRWTSEMAINYYKTVLGVAVQIMTMVLLVGIGNDLLSSFYARMNTGTLNFEELGVMLVFCVALLMLVNRVPPLIAGIISGTGIGNAGGIGNFGAGAAVGAAMGAASVAAGAASMAGAAVMSGAANLAGGASAVKAAFEKAQGSATSDAGAGMDMMASMGGVNTSGGQDSASSGASPFAQAAGFGGSASSGGSTSTGSSSGSSKGGDKSDGQGSSSTASTGNGADKAAKNEPKSAGRAGQGQQGGQQAAPGSTGPGGFTRAAALAASTAGELAKGAGAVLKGKAVQLADGFQERMDETIGGQVATAIRAGTAAEHPAFDGNSLAGNQAADPDDEVAAFVNRSTPA